MQPLTLLTTPPACTEAIPFSQRGFERIAAWVLVMLACGGLLGAAPAGALPYSQIVVFGDSLSDAGNNALAFDAMFAPARPRTPTPISGNSFIPLFPYASDRYTNDRVWAEYLAQALGLSTSPSLAGGNIFAFGGARTGPLGAAPPPTLGLQVISFLATAGGVASSDALYVVAGGGNNARDALTAISMGADTATTVAATAIGYASDVAVMVGALRAAGADDIVVWNTPDIGVTPAVEALGPLASALATGIATAMNGALLAALGATPEVRLFDFFDLVQDLTTNPSSFGLANADDACAQFTDCNPSNFLFWDGVHPTSAGHQRIAQAVLTLVAVPEPGSLVLLLAGLGGLFIARSRLNFV